MKKLSLILGIVLTMIVNISVGQNNELYIVLKDNSNATYNVNIVGHINDKTFSIDTDSLNKNDSTVLEKILINKTKIYISNFHTWNSYVKHDSTKIDIDTIKANKTFKEINELDSVFEINYEIKLIFDNLKNKNIVVNDSIRFVFIINKIQIETKRVITSVNNIMDNKLPSLNVYPNPTTDYLNITFDNINNENVYLMVMDLSGKMIYKNIINSSTKIDMRNYSNGTYIVRMNNETRKIIKK